MANWFGRFVVIYLGLVAPSLRPWVAVALGGLMLWWLLTLTP